MSTRKCTKCLLEKPYDPDPYKTNRKASGFMGCVCWDCTKIKITAKNRRRVLDPNGSGEIISYNTAKHRQRVPNPNKPGELISYAMLKQTQRRKDPANKLANNLRILLYCTLKRGKFAKSKTMEGAVQCTILKLFNHLEKQFKEGMSWENQGTEWHVDHRIPLSSAKDQDEFYKLWHYTNLQPMWGGDNISKGSNFEPLDKEAFLAGLKC